MKKEFKGQLKGFPKQVVKRMLKEQVKQGNPKDITVFERNKSASVSGGGFKFDQTELGQLGWFYATTRGDYTLFFERYPKKKKKKLRASTLIKDNLIKKEKPFPKLMKSATSGRIVFFEEPNKGIVISEKECTGNYGLGYKEVTWIMSHFEDYEIKC